MLDSSVMLTKATEADTFGALVLANLAAWVAAAEDGDHDD